MPSQYLFRWVSYLRQVSQLLLHFCALSLLKKCQISRLPVGHILVMLPLFRGTLLTVRKSHYVRDCLAQYVYDCTFWSNISVEETIDTKAPLKLKCCEVLSEFPSRHPSLIILVDQYLCLDLLSVHVIRHINGNTIISLHPDQDLPTTGEEKLHDRIRFAG